VAYPYITKTDLENRLSAEVLVQICDDNNDGTADTGPVARLCADSSSKVAGYLRGTYDLAAVAANPPNEVIRLTLDVAVAYAAQRHGEYVRRDWGPLMKAAEHDLENLRKGLTRLDVIATPEPAGNTGGTVRSGNPLLPEPPPKLFADGTGDF
jgi:phage gp36-like protein